MAAKKGSRTPGGGLISPGPGTYYKELPDSANWTKGTIVGRSARFKDNTNTNTSHRKQSTSSERGGESCPFGYNVEESYEKTARLSSSPKFMFPMEDRGILGMKRVSTPGPGEYSIAHRVGKQGVRVTIGNARRSLDSNDDRALGRIPCPTEYSPDHATIKPRHPAFTMAK